MAPFGSELAKLRAQELRMHPADRHVSPGRLRRTAGKTLIGIGTRLSGAAPLDTAPARRWS